MKLDPGEQEKILTSTKKLDVLGDFIIIRGFTESTGKKNVIY